MAQIICKDVSLGYDGKIITENINFEVNKGDYLFIVGENGAGKSTLMKALLGLIKPLSGKITYSGGLKTSDIGYLSQQTAVQRDFPASVREIVLSGCLNGCRTPFFGKREKQLAYENMERLNIVDFADKCYRELSGGQQQRVLLARALCSAKKLLFLDEPSTGLDPLITSQMYEITEQINKEGISIVMISHDIKNIKYADHILHLGAEPLFFGEKKDYLDCSLWNGGEEEDDYE